MTLIMSLDGIINVDAAFCLLPVTRLALPPAKRRTKKCKIPLCGIPGAILSMRYRGATRGIIRSSSTTHFKNSVTMDIATQTKNLSVKLSSCGFHISGATSVEQGKEGVQYIIDYVTIIQSVIDQMNEDPDLKERTFAWVKELVRGQPVILTASETDGPRLLHRIVQPNAESCLGAPDQRIAALLLGQCQDYLYYEDYLGELEGIAALQAIASPTLRIKSIRKAMVNYNYDLGFNINRPALARLFDGLDGFTARFDNAVEHSVTIELPYDPADLRELQRLSDEANSPPPIIDPNGKTDSDDDSDSPGYDGSNMYPVVKIPELTDPNVGPPAGRRKNKEPRHTFIVYQSGLVTQSGPDEALMKEPYERFNRLVYQHQSQIFKEGKGRKLKFTAQRGLEIIA